MSRCCSARRPMWCRGPREDPIANKLRRSLPAKPAYRHDALAQRVCWACISSGSARRKPERVKQLILGGVRKRSAPITTSIRISRRATIRGTSGSASCRTATSSMRSGRRRLRRHQRDRDVHRNRRPTEVRQRASPRTSSSPRPARAAVLGGVEVMCRRPRGRFREDAELQGHDVFRRAEFGLRLRLHQCVVDAEMRPHLRIRLPAAQPHGRHGYRQAMPKNGIPTVAAVAVARLLVGLCAARGRPKCPSKARGGRGGCTRTTRSTSSRCASARSTTA